ncbi:unnamed protein product [Kuraishia capsulata CBS 1993]|uniref:Uncharacterized protein n=1 Tax=Kuraishia capsulata CBS 1993 TaxID=1382522 RepID=W6MSP6_9ASCO|nr:uncharacterized protein KUCA_T00004234001 [Kuraishia capsulata CBS 1993]CDK28252.1 unnamed protein product [Kuraishia capsulata CBS 1993]
MAETESLIDLGKRRDQLILRRSGLAAQIEEFKNELKVSGEQDDTSDQIRQGSSAQLETKTSDVDDFVDKFLERSRVLGRYGTLPSDDWPTRLKYLGRFFPLMEISKVEETLKDGLKQLEFCFELKNMFSFDLAVEFDLKQETLSRFEVVRQSLPIPEALEFTLRCQQLGDVSGFIFGINSYAQKRQLRLQTWCSLAEKYEDTFDLGKIGSKTSQESPDVALLRRIVAYQQSDSISFTHAEKTVLIMWKLGWGLDDPTMACASEITASIIERGRAADVSEVVNDAVVTMGVMTGICTVVEGLLSA